MNREDVEDGLLDTMEMLDLKILLIYKNYRITDRGMLDVVTGLLAKRVMAEFAYYFVYLPK